MAEVRSMTEEVGRLLLAASEDLLAPEDLLLYEVRIGQVPVPCVVDDEVVGAAVHTVARVLVMLSAPEVGARGGWSTVEAVVPIEEALDSERLVRRLRRAVEQAAFERHADGLKDVKERAKEITGD
jgi:hypothetical protein